jgi:hypothetical protein
MLTSPTDFQLQYPPNSQPTDITLSQFLSIQEKGVSAWSFEPDYETISSVLVHARTEITFLPDPESASNVQSNLPLPKLNEVYYWETKLFDLPPGTNVAIGLSTKPYPAFRLPGLSRYSVAYHSNGDKSFHWPFTAQTYSQPLKEGDVLGVGYRPRSGTVFFTRNGFRVQEDAFVGLTRWNLFPTIGADGPCSLHVNLGQSGFVFIEANVKKWGLAPSVGTLAPPPAYGSERGSILLAAGGTIQSVADAPVGASSFDSRHSRRSDRRRRRRPSAGVLPVASSPLRASNAGLSIPDSPPPPITPILEEAEDSARAGPSSRYISPTDMPFHTPANERLPASPSAVHAPIVEEDSDGTDDTASPQSSRASSPPPPPSARGADYFNMSRRPRAYSHSSDSPLLPVSNTPAPPLPAPSRAARVLATLASTLTPSAGRTHHRARSESLAALALAPPASPLAPSPPTPGPRDIDLGAWAPPPRRRATSQETLVPRLSAHEPAPPSYSPLDPFAYAEGVRIDLPAEVITAAMEGEGIPTSAIGQSNRSERRNRRDRHDRT